MTTVADEIKEGLLEVLADVKGEETRVKYHPPKAVDVKEIRDQLGMSRQEFCARFGFSIASLRRWEKGEVQPKGCALVLLNVMKTHPKAVLETLGGRD
ncbi:MAG: type II toxin-antitoxin system MqsA family antitoxin [Candidatus Omnitrophica bacterium]|nr:type II toxin-antitoxin system MqsA family antitoxin [Candidatus Omnitrophota bacterium]MCB9782095.1 type II toxin-antitoxin system MqsA family antitoxin [Candidatus Omnitrophota bacterium]